MAVVLAATVYLVARVRVGNGLGAAPALLLLLPSTLYFSLSRFDVLCAFVFCGSLLAFARQRYLLAHFLLAVATFVKWYPALAFPVYVAFHLAEEGVDVRRLRALMRSRTLGYSAVFIASIVVFVLASIAAFTWRGVLAPYLLHAERGAQYFNLYWVLEQYRSPLGLEGAAWTVVDVAFAGLAFSIVPILLLVRVQSLRDLFRYAILGIYLFITFSRIDSPQWILWYVPPMLMFVRDPRTLLTLACLNVWNYAVFPIGFDALGMTSTTFSLLVFGNESAWGSADPTQAAFSPAGLILGKHEPDQPRSRPSCTSRRLIG